MTLRGFAYSFRLPNSGRATATGRDQQEGTDRGRDGNVGSQVGVRALVSASE
ncbi:hypothetical protein [Halorientalis sp.]|uniref:hypothetical protein n=1 Tax=Halorientalis sp. TaxID=1931229 RepID=UPI002633CE11|nr:hypothetical protein [Halorientalis sp.]